MNKWGLIPLTRHDAVQTMTLIVFFDPVISITRSRLCPTASALILGSGLPDMAIPTEQPARKRLADSM